MKLLYDFFPIILFYVAYKLYGIYAATAVAIVASIAQVGGNWLIKREVEKMHLISMGLIVLMGGLTLWLKDKSFFMLKPTIINGLFALVFLAWAAFTGKPLVQKLLNDAIELPDTIWSRLNWLWVGFFIVSALANLVFVQQYRVAEQDLLKAYPAITEQQLEHLRCDEGFPEDSIALCETAASKESLWADFKLFGLMALTIVFILLQAVYLAKHMPNEDESDAKNLGNENKGGEQ